MDEEAQQLINRPFRESPRGSPFFDHRMAEWEQFATGMRSYGQMGPEAPGRREQMMKRMIRLVCLLLAALMLCPVARQAKGSCCSMR